NQRSSFPRMPIEKPFSFQCCDVLHYRCLTGEPEMILDFARARRHSRLALLALDEIENASLSLCQHVAESLNSFGQASSNEHCTRLSFRAILRLRTVRSGFQKMSYSRTRSTRN